MWSEFALEFVDINSDEPFSLRAAEHCLFCLFAVFFSLSVYGSFGGSLASPGMRPGIELFLLTTPTWVLMQTFVILIREIHGTLRNIKNLFISAFQFYRESLHASANQYQTVKQILRYENICLHSSSRMFFRFSETLLFLQHHAHCLETCSIVAARSRKHAMQNYHSEYLLAL